MQALIIQGNGNNTRLGGFFKNQKYEIYYKNKKIIEHIIDNSKLLNCDTYLCIREGTAPPQINNLNIIYCSQTFSRIDTLNQCFEQLPKFYDEVIIHDCDTIIDGNTLASLKNDSIAVSVYKGDGLKYGFVELDKNFNYIFGNEKQTETDYISIGAYSVNFSNFVEYATTAENESLLSYYNKQKNVKAVYSKQHINVGDIESYINNLWKL